MDDEGDLILELTKQLAEARGQVEYEKKEKEYWMNKYLKLRQRHTVTIGRERRNSRDEDELVPRRPSPAPQPATSVDFSNQSHAIDLTAPRQRQQPQSISSEPQFSFSTPTSSSTVWPPPPPRRSNRFSAPQYSEDSPVERLTASVRRTSSQLVDRLDSRDNHQRMFHPTSVAMETVVAQSSNARTPSTLAGTRTLRRCIATDGTTRWVVGQSESSPSRGRSDPNEEASLALAMALQAEEVEEARIHQARVTEEAQRLHAAQLGHLSRQSIDSANTLDMFRAALGHQHPAHASHGERHPYDHHGEFLNPDAMSHDELVQLGERMGDVKKDRWRQRAAEVMSRLPSHRLQRAPAGGSSMCIVCRDDFATNDHVLSLPCAHIFHYDCAQGWIRNNNSCPTCKLPIEDD
ncbi:hypothetical protein, variant 2 [Aphanomyces invadans]|uniref:RING-type domain-containing protein n=1 Tax=Aphanomyces invadans TaxID=157072 RepID=A0A024UGY0_9STRA|nr:hypothetical protein, variant 2 [Aphanomyces invadans]ETW04873.1 hypothetical protein, variant 2 [Aphanomyces invadans]|eukprot:XP_008866311.1 hypothetical protein, variant 2 [Aphanomyces invadans]